MKDAHRKRLESAGFRIGTVAEYLNLTINEEKYINIKVALTLEVLSRRKRSQLTQTELAQRAGTSQSRIAKLEACDPSVSFDLLVRVLIALETPTPLVTKILLRKPSHTSKKSTVARV